MRYLALALVGAFALGGCAAAIVAGAGLPAEKPMQKTADVQSESQAFLDAVLLYCIPHIETGAEFESTPLAALSTFRQPAEGERTSIGPAKAGIYTTQAGVVSIDASEPNTCRVSAYGLPVDSLFGVIAAAVTPPANSFTQQPVPPDSDPKVFLRRFERLSADLKLTIFLNGNEPGAKGTLSRFSTLMASVRKSPAEE
jgi:hypothetical protein